MGALTLFFSRGFLLFLCLFGVLPNTPRGPAMPAPFPLPGEWPTYRRNGTLDAHSPLRGAITHPHLAWKQFVGATEQWAVVPGEMPACGTPPVAPPSFDPAILSDPRWGLTAPTGDIEGHTQPLVQNSTTTYAHILPDAPGLQKIVFESAFAKPTQNGDWAHDCRGRCYTWRQGRWELVWESEPIDALFLAQPLVGDFDGDGQPEIAILPWKELLILDARTGKLKARCAFTEGRSYGFFGAYDLEGKGRTSAFVIQADFAKHVDVLGYRKGNLSVLWRQEIEMDISNPQKVLRVPPEPVADVDGDGKKEVLVSLFNGTGDGHWHLTVHDGLTGAVKADLVDEYLQGVADVDGDGTDELLTVHTPGAGVPNYGQLHVWSLKTGKPICLWEGKRMAWQMWNRPQPAHINSGATFSGQDVLARRVHGRMRVVLRQPRSGGSQTQLRLCEWQGSGFVEIRQPDLHESCTGTDIAAVAMDAEGQVLVRKLTTSGSSQKEHAAHREGAGATGQPLGYAPRGVPAVACAVAWEQGTSSPTILVSGGIGTEEIVAFHPPTPEHPVPPLHRFAGRGLGFNWPQAEMYGPVIADLFGDGRRQHLYATSSPQGYARLVAADLNHREIWHTDFPEIPGTPPLWNTGGIVYWQAGHFTDRQRMDVLVTVRRSMMHSEETALLSGQNGKPLWRRDRQEGGHHSRGVGGTPFALADFDGDGLDDVACLHPSDFYILQGKTGKNLLAKDAHWAELPGADVYWGVPIAGDFERVGHAALFFGTSRRSLTGLLRGDGSLVWWDARDKATTCLPAFGDFTGSGRSEVAGIGFEDGIRCYDAATGKILWRLADPAEGVPCETASADINGDGQTELLFSAGQTLYCVGAVEQNGKKTGALLWKCEFSAQVGPPVVADMEGRGTASVLVVGADGWVYCVQ